MTALLLLAMMAQQCPPGTYCPVPTATATAPTWQLYQLQIDGRTVTVPAYQWNGTIYYDATKVPPKPGAGATIPKLGGSDTALAGDTINYGLDIEAIAADVAGDRNTFQTNDPALGSLLIGDTPGDRLFKPEVKIDVPDLTRPLVLGGALIAAAILFTNRRPRQ